MTRCCPKTPLLAMALVSLATAAVAAPKVTVERGDSTVDVLVGGTHFATLNVGSTLPRPYWHPIHGPGQAVVSDTRPGDHKHHTGLWIGVEHVNGVDYWGSRDVMQQAEVPTGNHPGKIVNREVDVLEPKGDRAVLKIVNDWIGSDGKPAVRETTHVAIGSNGLMSFDVVLTAVADEVEFEDTKEGFFAFRLPEELTTKKGTGTIVNPAGEQGETASWGKPNAWLDYHGTTDGKHVGVALFDHPDNFRPSRYHVRGYGLFAVSPFGEHVYSKKVEPAKPVHLKKGESIHLRYAAYVHGGDTKQADVAGVHAAWAKGE